jgi:hypothetical protein
MAKYIKPTVDTKFHIDFTWWQSHNLTSTLRNHACPNALNLYESYTHKTYDWINRETGQVYQLSILWRLIQTHCHEEPEFINYHLPLTTAIFRLFILNDNLPLSPTEIHAKIRKRTPEVILTTINRQVYEGIRPVTRSI